MCDEWWGYLHINNTIQVKRYFDCEDLHEANASPFVKIVVNPFKATGRENALEIIKQKLGVQ